MQSARVPGFLPSTSGLPFGNRFPHGPVAEVRLPGVRIPIGDAARGLCGGMVFAARDLFEARLRPPESATPPPRGSPLFDYLVRRLFASWSLPFGPLRYALWSALPDDDLLSLRGTADRTVTREWPLVRADIDGGTLSPLGLVRVRSINPWRLARNHQVLAYGYDLDEHQGDLRIRVYDPNHPGDDDLALRFNVREPLRAWPIPYRRGGLPVRGFFRTRYRSPTSGITFRTSRDATP
jgi:hypothetical protein